VGDDNLRQQVIELQSQMAFQEDTVLALNEALSRQQRELLVLRRQLELIKQRQDEHAVQLDPEMPPIVDEKPPHY
jgi:SlyX protein